MGDPLWVHYMWFIPNVGPFSGTFKVLDLRVSPLPEHKLLRKTSF